MAEMNCPNCNGTGRIPGCLEDYETRDGQTVKIRTREKCPICRGEGKVDDR